MADPDRTGNWWSTIERDGPVDPIRILLPKSVVAELVGDAAVTTAKLDDEAVTTAKLDDEAVTTAKLDDAAVTTAKLDDAAVTGTKHNVGIVTSLPASPADGQECIFDPSAWTVTGTAEVQSDVQWHLRYRQSTGKWHFIGGQPLVICVNTQETRSVNSYASLTTAGPGLTAGVAGDFVVQVGFTYGSLAAAGGFMSYDVGGTSAVDADSAIATNGTSSLAAAVVSIPRRKTLAASSALLAKYKANAGTAVYERRWMSVLPIRLG